jgi:His-Xaa-Ser system radical SAM maturase HxsB
MIVPFNFKQFGNEILLTNDFGRYIFLKKHEFEQLLNKQIDKDSKLYKCLEENYFVFDTSVEEFIYSSKQELRSGKSYLFAATSLHIFVVTNFCNAECVYCQAQSGNIHTCKMMSEEIAKRAVDIALQSPQKELTFEFQGGEPLSNFEIIKYIIDYSKTKKANKKIQYSIVSNLTLLTEEMMMFFKENNVSVSTSLDGNCDLHNINRPLAKGRTSYEIVKEKMKLLNDNDINIGAIQTTTKKSLDYSQQIIDEYLESGLTDIFIRPLTPLGHALDRWENIGYTPQEFLVFYEKCLRYILDKNKEGIWIREGHANIFLSKIINGCGINYMELRSPCGAAVGQMAYYYDGNIFTCDEGRMLYEMGDDSFKIGDVMNSSYDTLMDSKLCKTVCKYSIIEDIPQCCDCVYQPYCGTCPVINYALDNDVINRRRRSYRCQIYKGMLDIIFGLLKEEEYLQIMRRWVQ